jgi:hypothetical protein
VESAQEFEQKGIMHDGVVATLQANVGNSMDFVVSVSTIDLN